MEEFDKPPSARTQQKTTSYFDFVSVLLTAPIKATQSKTGSYEKFGSFYSRLKKATSFSRNKVTSFKRKPSKTRSTKAARGTEGEGIDEEEDEDEVLMTLNFNSHISPSATASAWADDERKRTTVSETLRSQLAKKRWRKVKTIGTLVGRAAILEKQRKAKQDANSRFGSSRAFFGASNNKSRTVKINKVKPAPATQSSGWVIDDLDL